MSSRLFIKVREQQGLAYYIRTIPECYTDTGYLVTHAGVDNKRLPEVLKIILGEYKNIQTKKIPEEELAKIKENAKGHLYLGLEASDDWASYNGVQEILKGKVDAPERECASINKVTQEDILKAAKDIFRPNNLNLALIGPFREKKKFESLLKNSGL